MVTAAWARPAVEGRALVVVLVQVEPGRVGVLVEGLVESVSVRVVAWAEELVAGLVEEPVVASAVALVGRLVVVELLVVDS